MQTNVTDFAKRGAGIAAENPLGLAIGAAAVGFLAGLAVPITEYERERVGPLRDELLDRAHLVGSDAIEHGKQVIAETAQAALATAQESAQRHAQQVVREATSMSDRMSNGNTTPTSNTGDVAAPNALSDDVLGDEAESESETADV